MIDYIIIAIYFILILYLGLLFRNENNTISGYLKAKSTLPWWWVGASAYVSQFSAASFTILAAEAYTNTYNVLIPFIGNAIAFFVAALYFAKKFRQLKVNNAIEAIRLRFGSRNANMFSILYIPNLLIYPTFWLSGLSVFIASALGLPVKFVIISVGLITLCMSLIGGAWAIISSDFLQTLIIMSISLFSAIIAFIKFKSLGGLFHVLPLRDNILPVGSTSTWAYSLWVVYMLMQKFFSTNNINNVQRFNSVDSSKSAGKSSLFTSCIYIVGILIWFLPVWYLSTQNLDLASVFPDISRPNQAAYLYFVREYLPQAGFLGLLIIALFSATMSSIDSSLNWCTGYIVSMYKKKDGGNEKSILRIGRLTTFALGLGIIFMTLFLDALWKSSFFELIYTLIGYLYIPIIIPIFLALFIRKTPDWSLGASIAAGLFVSLLFGLILKNTQDFWQQIATGLGITEPSGKDIFHIKLASVFIIQLVLGGGIFALSTLWYSVRPPREERVRDIREFYTRLSNVEHTDPALIASLKPKFTQVHAIGIAIILSMLSLFIFKNNMSTALLAIVGFVLLEILLLKYIKRIR